MTYNGVNRWLKVWMLTCALLLVSCAGGGPSPTPTRQEVRVTTPPTATSPPSTNVRRLTLTAADGVTLVGAFYPPPEAPAPGVLLLHMAGRRKEDWAQFATRLQEAGYAVLALDLRGHGESSGEPDWATMPDDVARAWAVLIGRPEVDPGRTAIVGASIGANLALVIAAEEPQVRAVVLLSPGMDYRGIQTEEAMTAYGERPVLIAASQDDAYAAESAQVLDGLAQGQHVLVLYPRAGHGTDMFGPQPDLPGLILSWLNKQVGR